MRVLHFLLLLAASVLLVHGMQTIGMGYTGYCRCLNHEHRLIPSKNLRSIEIIPRGADCKITEVIATLRSGERICLDHRANWVKKLVSFIKDKRRLKG